MPFFDHQQHAENLFRRRGRRDAEIAEKRHSKAIYNPPDAVFQHPDIEIDQQAKRLAGQTQIREQLRLVQR